MSTSSIEWTDATWNPVTGCTKISPGCKLCYAERLSARLKAMGQKKYRNGFELTLHAPEQRQVLSGEVSELVLLVDEVRIAIDELLCPGRGPRSP